MYCKVVSCARIIYLFLEKKKRNLRYIVDQTNFLGFFCVSAAGRGYLAGRTVPPDQGRSYTSQWLGGTVPRLHRSTAERSPSQSNRWDILREWKRGRHKGFPHFAFLRHFLLDFNSLPCLRPLLLPASSSFPFLLRSLSRVSMSPM